jgi:hypothetical protein
MADEDAAAVEETPSDDDAPVDETETPSDGDETDEGPADDEPADEDTDEEPEGEPTEDPAVANLLKKLGKEFAHITDPKKREAAVAKAYWEKTNYASATRRENEALKRRIAEIESSRKEPEKPKDPPPPDPDLQALDQRIQDLQAKDTADKKSGDAQLVALNEVDTEIAKLQGKLEDAKEAADESKAALLESRIETKQTKRDAIVARYEDIRDRRVSRSFDYERLNRDRAWLANVIADRSSRQAKEQEEAAAFKSEFPEKVDGLIEGAARRIGIPEHNIEELLTIDMLKLGDADLDEADLPDLVEKRVEKFARDRDLSRRTRFAERSKAKAKVVAPAKAGTPAPAKKPVAPAQMAATGLGPKMNRARQYLREKGWG